MTRTTREEFDRMESLFAREIMERTPANGRPPFRGDPARASDGGNWRLPRTGRVLLTAPVRRACGTRRGLLAGAFGLDRSAASDRLKFADRIPGIAPPTAKNTTETLTKCKTPERKRYMRGRAAAGLTSTARARACRPGRDKPDPEHPEGGAGNGAGTKGEGGTFSGKTKTNRFDTPARRDKRGTIVRIGATRNGAAHDAKIARELPERPPFPGDPDIPEGDRPAVRGDAAFGGPGGAMRGANVETPHKKPPGGGGSRRRGKRGPTADSTRTGRSWSARSATQGPAGSRRAPAREPGRGSTTGST